MPSIRQSHRPVLGEDHSYSLVPPVQFPCEFWWLINGQYVRLGEEIGGLKVEGIGASGTLSVETVGDTTGTTVHAIIVCPGVGVDISSPIDVSTGETPVVPDPPETPLESPPEPPEGPGPPDSSLLDRIRRWWRNFDPLGFLGTIIRFLLAGGLLLIFAILFGFSFLFPWLWNYGWFKGLLGWLWRWIWRTTPPWEPPPIPVPPDPPTPEPPTPPTPPVNPSPPTTPVSPVVPRPPVPIPIPVPTPPCTVTAAVSRVQPRFPGSTRMVVEFRGIAVSPTSCTWLKRLDQYSVVPNVPHTIHSFGNNVEIVIDTTGMARRSRVYVDAIWTCRCANGRRHVSYGRIVGIV